MLVEWRAALVRPLKRGAAAERPDPRPLAEDFRRRGRVVRAWTVGERTYYLVEPVGLKADLARCGIPDEFDSITHDNANKCVTLSDRQAIPVPE